MGTFLALLAVVENVTRATGSQRVVIAATVLLGVATLASTAVEGSDGDGEQSFIQRVVAQTARSGLTVRGRRDLRAGTASGKHEGWMRVETTLTPAGGFSWQVLEEGGSSRTREKVFRAVLETEAQACRAGDRDAAALTPENYTFTPMGSVGSGEQKIRLEPRRRDPRLIDGHLIVDGDGYPVRLEGTLAKSPSFWVKSVRVVKRYGRFAGVALPTVVETTADLKLVGQSTFTMRYTYTHVNGRSVGASDTALNQ
jgi:hypothetical protein